MHYCLLASSVGFKKYNVILFLELLKLFSLKVLRVFSFFCPDAWPKKESSGKIINGLTIITYNYNGLIITTIIIKIEVWPGAVAHACNPSTLVG